MTFEELHELNNLANELNDLRHGLFGIEYYERLVRQCETHKEFGSQNISVTIDFLKARIEMPVAKIIEHINDQIADMKSRVKILQSIMNDYQVPEAYKNKLA